MRFGARVRAATDGLSVPPRARVRILEELAGDLEDLYAALRATGLSEREARRRAERLLAPRPEALNALAGVHRPVWARFGGTGAVERGFVALLFGGMVWLSWMAVARAGLRTGMLFVPIAAIAVAGAGLALRKAVRIWGLGESSPAPVRAGAGDLLVAATGALFAACFGIVFELWRVAGTVEGAPDGALPYVTEWLRASVALAATGIGVALLCGLAWLAFVQRAAVLERAERRILGPVLHVHRGLDLPGESGNGRDR